MTAKNLQEVSWGLDSPCHVASLIYTRTVVTNEQRPVNFDRKAKEEKTNSGSSSSSSIHSSGPIAFFFFGLFFVVFLLFLKMTRLIVLIVTA